MGSCLCLILRYSFRIIFILLRYVATITMKAFYDEALLKIAFKHCYDEPTMFMMLSAHRASRPHGMAYFIIMCISLAGILSKTFTSSDTVCLGHRSGAICRYF